MEEKRKFIALLRVSTQKQGSSGLGLEGQQFSINNYVQHVNGIILETITEVESAGNKDKISIDNNLNIEKLLRKRPRLLSAIQLAQKEKACIIVKEASRLSRFSLLIDFLLSSGASFICADSPNDTPMIIKLKTSINEEELLKISSRTKAALQVKKARGATLGSPQNLTAASRKRSVTVRRDNAMNNQNHKMIGYILMCRDKGGMTFQGIADRLNSENHKTTNAKIFYASTAWWLYEKGKKFSIRV
jgi:DNA invertase Pin-like site-specific DNA recombinase